MILQNERNKTKSPATIRKFFYTKFGKIIFSIVVIILIVIFFLEYNSHNKRCNSNKGSSFLWGASVYQAP